MKLAKATLLDMDKRGRDSSVGREVARVRCVRVNSCGQALVLAARCIAVRSSWCSYSLIFTQPAPDVAVIFLGALESS